MNIDIINSYVYCKFIFTESKTTTLANLQADVNCDRIKQVNTQYAIKNFLGRSVDWIFMLWMHLAKFTT